MKTLIAGACLSALMALPVFADPDAEVAQLLDRFHRAAAEGDFDSYFASLTPGAVFLGTDAGERWQGEAFRSFSKPHFENGGWRYTPTERHIDLDAERGVAWFDELLSHDRLGQCRGSGVALYGQDGWKITQYNLSLPVPNELVEQVAASIRSGDPGSVGDPVADAVAPASETDADSEVEPAAPEEGCRRKRHKTNKKAGC